MNKEEWDKFCQVFQLDVKVTVPKKVTKDDIIITLLSDGDFVFKDGDSHTKINLSHLKGKSAKETIKAMEDIIWKPIVSYMEKHFPNSESDEQ